MNELFSRCDPASGKQDCGGTPAPPTPPPTPVPSPSPSPSPTPTPISGCMYDCGLNGDCDKATNTCKCDNGWKGPHCTTLDVRPIPAGKIGYKNASMPTWGGEVMFDQATKKYHMFVDARANPSTQLATDDSYTCNNKVVHLQGDSPAGPYHWVRDILPRMHYNPHLVQAPDGSLMLFVLGNPNSPDPDTPEGKQYCQNCWLWSTDTIRMSFASGPNGEWSESRNVFNPAPGPSDRHQWDCSTQNPAVVILDDESVVMAYRAHVCVDSWPPPYPNPPPNEYIGLATAPSWRCLVDGSCDFTRVRDTPLFGDQEICSAQMQEWLGGCNIEDPVFWKSKRGFHMLFHGGNISTTNYNYWGDSAQTQGAYAYSKSAQGPWTLVPNSYESPWPAKTPAPVSFDNGTTTELWRRQKPGLIFDKTGRPTHITNGVDQQHTGDPSTAGCFWQTGWTMVQPIGDADDLSVV